MTSAVFGMREPATTMPLMTESASVTKSTAMTPSAVTASKLVSTATPSAIMTPSIMIPSVTVSTAVVWMAPSVSVGWISTAVTVTVIYVVAALSRNQTNQE
jgi:hypothetical protein